MTNPPGSKDPRPAPRGADPQPRTLVLRFDFISPYAYFAWKQAPEFCAAHGLELEPQPILFAALLNHWGQLGPAEVPPKRVYTFKHCVRRAARLGLDFALPPTHPFNPLLALRVAALDFAPQERFAIIDAFFDATWGRGKVRGIDRPQKLAAIVDGLGFDGAATLARAGENEHKAAFRAANDAAIAQGVFGVPTLSIDHELFWGSDVFEDLAARIAGDDPIDAAQWSDSGEPPVGAQRPR